MAAEPFFRRDGERFVPTDSSRGPWDAGSLHGRVVIGLLGVEVEARHGGPDYLPARLTVDLYRLPDLSPVTVVSRVLRDGYRIKVVDAEFVSGGVSVGRASCQLLRRSDNTPPGFTATPPAWDAPAPETIAPPPDNRAGLGGMWATRTVTGAWNSPGPRRAWIGEVRELVGGTPLTPFARVALAADFASPFAHGGAAGLGYINTDVTVLLHRLPVGEWIGFEATRHHATDGIAIGECVLHDPAGPIGLAAVAALAQKLERG